MAGDEEMTVGELGRLVKGLAAEIREDRKSYLALAVWQVEKSNFEERFRNQGREIGELRTTLKTMETEKDAEHKALNIELAAVRKEGAERTEAARKARAQTWLAIGLSVLGVILAVGGNLVTNALIGGAP
jgi:C4-dicarboxylate-specific signal transduction histidine kinase